ncbi:TPA: hypothetical protein N2F43_000098 [Salmonella enterica]|nr:hypothetical protein [Salmonella enterica]
MINRNVIFAGVILIAGIVIGVVIYWHATYALKNFSCEGQLTLLNKKTSYDLLINFTFADGTGLYEATGRYKDQYGNVVSTSNKVVFDYWRKEKNIYLISKETNELPATTTPLISWKPDFFRKRHRGITFQVIQENTEGYLFLYDHTPLFYCTLHNR